MDRAKFPIHQVITFDMPTAGVSAEGITLINQYLVSEGLPALPVAWDTEWLVTRGEFSGTFPKRWAAWMYRSYQYRAPSGQIAVVGNLAQQHNLKTQQFHFDFDDTLEWRAGDFGDGNSCFWGGRTLARDMMREHNSFAVRFFKSAPAVPGKNGYARAWMTFPEPGMTLEVERGKSFTHDQVKESWLTEGAMIFNAYGMELVRMARILSTWLGLSYKKVPMTNRGGQDGVLYMNGGTGYVMALPEMCELIVRVDMHFRDNARNCSECGNRIGRGEVVEHANRDYCRRCFEANFAACASCQRVHRRNQTHEVRIDRAFQRWCQNCFDLRGARCEHCDDYVDVDQTVVLLSQEMVCHSCYASYGTACAHCGHGLWHRDATSVPLGMACQSCIAEHYVMDAASGQWMPVTRQEAENENAVRHAAFGTEVPF